MATKRKYADDNGNDNDQRIVDEPIVVMKRLRQYAYTIEELQQKLKLAQYASEGKLHISRLTHPFPLVTVDLLLHDLCDMDNPVTASEVDPQRVQLIVDILWEVTRCQNRSHTAFASRPHDDDTRFPSIGIMFRRNQFYQRLAYIAGMPTVGVETQIRIVNLFALCAASAPARYRLIRTPAVAELFAVFLASPYSEDAKATTMLRDEAVLRCLLTCRDWLNRIDNATFDFILAAICGRIRYWGEAPGNFQLACALVVCAVGHRFHRLLTMTLLLNVVVENIVTGPHAQDTNSVRPVLGFVRVLVMQPTSAATLTLLAHTSVLQLLTSVISAESSDEISLISALTSVANICYDLTVVDATSQIKEKLAALGPMLLTLAYTSPVELVRFESFVALVMLIQMLNVYVSDQGAYSKPWTFLLDWETFGQCAFSQLEAGTQSQPPQFDACLAAVSAVRIAVVRLGSCEWLKPNIRDWTRLLTELSAPPFLSVAVDDESAPMTQRERDKAVPYQVRCAASALSSLISSYQFFTEPCVPELFPSLLA